jgi:hypothetical protein
MNASLFTRTQLAMLAATITGLTIATSGFAQQQVGSPLEGWHACGIRGADRGELDKIPKGLTDACLNIGASGGGTSLMFCRGGKYKCCSAHPDDNDGKASCSEEKPMGRPLPRTSIIDRSIQNGTVKVDGSAPPPPPKQPPVSTLATPADRVKKP